MSKYTDKVKGSLLAAALGDGLGAFSECLHYETVEKKVQSFPPHGHTGIVEYTDDTALRLALYEAILSGGVNAWSFANQWKSNVVDPKVFWISELYVTALLGMGEDPHRTGQGNLIADNAAMAADPFGTMYPCLDEVAALRAFETMSICQAGIGQEGAMAVAAAVSISMRLETSMDDVVDAAGRHVGRDMKSRIEKTLSIVAETDDPRKQLYKEMLVEDGTSDLVWNEMIAKPPIEMSRRLVNLGVSRSEISMGISPLEVVPVAIAYAVKGEKEPVRAIKDAAAFGRDSDTISGIAGAILGAYHGAEAFPKDTFNVLPRTLLTRAAEISVGMQPIAQKNLDRYAASLNESKRLFT
jgi:ADP-ribosylglycohydrolase